MPARCRRRDRAVLSPGRGMTRASLRHRTVRPTLRRLRRRTRCRPPRQAPPPPTARPRPTRRAPSTPSAPRTPGVTQSVLTGNIKPVAIIKLAAFGLDPYLDFEIGAYGSDDPVRANLVEIARQRASQKYRLPFNETSTVLIGDTPSDIKTARQGGARIIAVASGQSDVAELRAAGAEIVLSDLADTARLAAPIIGHRH